MTGPLLRVATPDDAEVVIDTRLGPTPMDLTALRRTAGLAVDWAAGPTPRDWCRTVAGLAMGGVPILAQPLPLWARRFLDPVLAATLVAPVDLGDLLDREVHSIRQRRAASRVRRWHPDRCPPSSSLPPPAPRRCPCPTDASSPVPPRGGGTAKPTTSPF